jgi:hypothetical protein
MMNALFTNYNGRFYVNPPGNPGAFPTYFTHAGDPTVTINLFETYGASNLQGAVVPMPVNAVPAAPSDAHMNIIDPTTGNDWEYYEFPQILLSLKVCLYLLDLVVF